MVLYSFVWSRMVPYGPVWYYMVPYGPLWSLMVLYGQADFANLREGQYFANKLFIVVTIFRGGTCHIQRFLGGQ